MSDRPGDDVEEARARRVYVLVIVWGVATLAVLFWFSRHWRA